MSVPIHLPHQQPSPIAVSTPLTIPNSLMTSTQVLSFQTLPAACQTCSTHFSQPFDHYSIITPLFSSKQINPLALLPLLGSPVKSSVLSLLAAVWNAPTSPHTLFFTLKCFGLLPTATINLYPPPKRHSTPHLSSPPHPNLEFCGKLSITSCIELQIASYPYHLLWLPYHSYMTQTSLIKSQSYISTYKPTSPPPSSFSATFTPSSTSLLHSCHLTRNRQFTFSII